MCYFLHDEAGGMECYGAQSHRRTSWGGVLGGLVPTRIQAKMKEIQASGVRHVRKYKEGTSDGHLSFLGEPQPLLCAAKFCPVNFKHSLGN